MLWGKRADMTIHGTEPFNVEPPRRALARGIRTDAATFYVRNHGPVPELEPSQWRLRVRGRVRGALDLSLHDLRTRFCSRAVVATLQCAGNRRAGLMRVRDIPGEAPWGPGATSTATWTGVRLVDVLDAAGVGEDARHVEFVAADVSHIATPAQRFGGSIPLSKATGGAVLLAWAMNGVDLPTVHGAPVRVIVPGYVGARSVKWLEEMNVRRDPSDNYFQATAYRLLPPEADPDRAGHGDGLSLGPIAVNSDILAPEDGDSVHAGPTVVTGYALAGDDRGIARVDVSVDGGRRWTQAELGEQSGPWAWRLWHATVEVPPGLVEITARAWDTAAAAQPEHEAPLWNPKGYVNNAWPRIQVMAHSR